MSKDANGADPTSTAPAKDTPPANAAAPNSNQGDAAAGNGKELDKSVDQSGNPGGNAAAPKIDPPKAPEKYELVQRKDSPLLKEDVAEIEANAKAQGLSQEQAQKLVESKEADHDKFFSRQIQQAKDQQTLWRSEVEADKEIAGTDGKAFKQNVELAKRAMDRFADDQFKKVLSETGLGNNPHLIRTFLRIGRGMADDTAVLDGSSSTPTKKSREEKLFPTNFKEKRSN